MAKKIIKEEVAPDVFNTPVETEEKPVEVVESAAKVAFRKLIEDYAKANPVKYEGKKEALEAQLNAMK